MASHLSKVFSLSEHGADYTVRVQADEETGEPWFHAGDICEVLGYTKARDAVGYHCEGDDAKTFGTIDSLNRTQQSLYVNESGLYDLILGSKKPHAKNLKRWVTKVVLPAIRKDGGYVDGEEKVVSGEMSEDELVLKALQMQQAKVTRLLQEKQQLEVETQEQQKTIGTQGAIIGTHLHTLDRFALVPR
uniref:Bro-N domain-containing protein n=1 Tax=Magnetococcus massalia (strain MO-1) TaxID=451514 RepID=A0A1S7LNQ9_MAGMO|nr:protein of unknown function [include part of BRO family, N-terminal domain] [Candidatus Magnetococcus massalia]